MKRLLLAILIVMQAASAQAFDLTSIQGAWELDNSTADASGNSRTLTLNNSPTYGTGKVGTHCLTLVSASSRDASIGGLTGLLNNASAATLACWFKSSTAAQQIMLWSTNGSGTARAQLYINSSGALVASARAGDAESLQTKTGTPTGYADGNWHHAAAVIDYAADTITLYHNGSSISSTGTISFTATATSATNPTAARIGSRTTDYWNGDLDQPIVFARALTAGEISTLYNGGTGLAYPWLTSGTVQKVLLQSSLRPQPKYLIRNQELCVSISR